jgi:hypothetical protein
MTKEKIKIREQKSAGNTIILSINTNIRATHNTQDIKQYTQGHNTKAEVC